MQVAHPAPAREAPFTVPEPIAVPVRRDDGDWHKQVMAVLPGLMAAIFVAALTSR